MHLPPALQRTRNAVSTGLANKVHQVSLRTRGSYGREHQCLLAGHRGPSLDRAVREAQVSVCEQPGKEAIVPLQGRRTCGGLQKVSPQEKDANTWLSSGCPTSGVPRFLSNAAACSRLKHRQEPRYLRKTPHTLISPRSRCSDWQNKGSSAETNHSKVTQHCGG